MKAISIRELNTKHSFEEPIFSTVEDVNEHLKSMNKLGFTNTGIYLDRQKSGLIMAALQLAGYRVFGEVNPYKDTIIEIEWFPKAL